MVAEDGGLHEELWSCWHEKEIRNRLAFFLPPHKEQNAYLHIRFEEHLPNWPRKSARTVYVSS